MYKLVISDDEGKTTVVPLVRDEITIGRKEGNTIRLTERNVSRRHARLARLNGHFIIHDLDSYNGVRINGRRIDDETTLEAGDKVVIGDYVLALQNEDATAITANPNTVAAPPARLVMLTPPAPGAEFALPERPVRIGRAEDLDVWVNHRSISREHAEIRREGDEVHLIDLESANGVRLNNKEVTEAVLTPGDEIELGQVRFRFVGEGERYSFEADRTVQMDALVLPETPGSSKKTMYVGIGIIAVAALVGGAFALNGGGETDPVVTPIVANDPVEDPPEVESELDQTLRLIAATEACVSALREENFDAAREAGELALSIDPESGMAQDCMRRASDRTGAGEQFAEGAAHLEAGRFEDAWMAFDSLPEGSEFRQRPEVEQARVAFMQHYLDSARAQAEEGARDEARQQLQQVFAVGDDEDELYASARGLEEELAAADRADQQNNRRRRNNSRMDSYHEINMNTTAMMVAAPPDMTVTMMDPPPSASTPQQIMRECNFANRCVAERLERGPKNATTLPFLIEAYRNLGNTGQSRSLMSQYVRRYPNGAEASRYQRMLDAQR